MTFKPGLNLARWYAHGRPEPPTPAITTSGMAFRVELPERSVTVVSLVSGLRRRERSDLLPLDHHPRDLPFLNQCELVVTLVIDFVHLSIQNTTTGGHEFVGDKFFSLRGYGSCGRGHFVRTTAAVWENVSSFSIQVP